MHSAKTWAKPVRALLRRAGGAKRLSPAYGVEFRPAALAAARAGLGPLRNFIQVMNTPQVARVYHVNA